MAKKRARKKQKKDARAPGKLAKPLLSTEDQGKPVRIDGQVLGEGGERWLQPFLEANRSMIQRLGLEPEISALDGMHVSLRPGNHIGAIPLVSPATRRVVAGLLVKPRFRWVSLGAVMEKTGFASEPVLGGGPMVPGSAREVPPWLLAGPVLRRLKALLEHQKRGFVESKESRPSPRGRIEWKKWATSYVPTGRWTQFPCVYPDPSFDPDIMMAIRWTVQRLAEDLTMVSDAPVGRALLLQSMMLLEEVGPGPASRPRSDPLPAESEFLSEGLEAMGWVAEERGLGGARSLDGLCWDLPVEELWESWVRNFISDLAPRLGMQTNPQMSLKRSINWSGRIQSMGSLMPDAMMEGRNRTVWIDAKYKPHLSLIARKQWSGAGDKIRDSHRADLHQALAYANLSPSTDSDTILAYPDLGDSNDSPLGAKATIGTGERRVRLILGSIPFGFRSVDHRESALRFWRELLSA